MKIFRENLHGQDIARMLALGWTTGKTIKTRKKTEQCRKAYGKSHVYVLYNGEWTVDYCQLFLVEVVRTTLEKVLCPRLRADGLEALMKRILFILVLNQEDVLIFNDVIVFYDKIPYVFIVLVLLSDNVFYLCKVNVWHGYVWVVCIWVWKKIIDIAYNKGPENWVNFCVNMLTFTN